MRIRRRHVAWILPLAAVTGLVAWWTLKEDDLAREARANFEWFSTLGFPDLKDRPCVRVATGEVRRHWDEPPSNTWITAFLLSTKGNTFTVLTPDLEQHSYTNTPAGTPESERVGFQTADLRQQARLQLRALGRPTDDNGHGREDRLSGRTEIFTFAWACWRQGLNSEARDLYFEATLYPRPTPSHRGHLTARKVFNRGREYAASLVAKLRPGNNRGQPPRPFREELEEDLAMEAHYRAIRELCDPAIDRAQLLARFESIWQTFPKHEYRADARKTADTLKKMIEEDRAHPVLSPEAFDRLPIDQKVAELIFRLRDQSEYFYYWYTTELPADAEPGLTNSPAYRLKLLGHAAVPQLITAIDSNALSRARSYPGHHGGPGFDHPSHTVGGQAKAILCAVSGRFAMSGRRDAEDWWSEIQAKGEKQTLTDGVAAGGEDSFGQAQLLCARYPEVAAATLARGLKATTNGWVRIGLIDNLAKVEDPAAVEVLSETMLRDSDRDVRVAAATGLRSRNREQALAAMMKEWEKLPEPAYVNDEGADRLIRFLAGTDSANSIAALQHNLRRWPVDTRYEIVDSVGDTQGRIDSETNSPASTTLAAIESLLALALEDTEVCENQILPRRDSEIPDPRVCDLAAYHLSERWPERYKFDVTLSLHVRERQRVANLNSWRKTQSLPALPPAPTLPSLSPRQATRVTLIEWTTNGVRPGKAFADRVAKLLNRPLHPGDLVNLLSSFAGKPEPGASGLELRILKDDDLTGVQLIFKLVAGTPPTASQNWDVNERGFLRGEELIDEGDSDSPENCSDVEYWWKLEDALGKAIAAPPTIPFSITVGLGAGK